MTFEAGDQHLVMINVAVNRVAFEFISKSMPVYFIGSCRSSLLELLLFFIFLCSIINHKRVDMIAEEHSQPKFLMVYVGISFGPGQMLFQKTGE